MRERSIRERWLACLLTGRATVDAATVRRAAVAYWVNWRTVQRAADRLGLTRRRVGFGRGSRVQWLIGDSIGTNIMRLAAVDGVTVRLEEGSLMAKGPRDALERWRPTLVRLKADLRRVLDGAVA